MPWFNESLRVTGIAFAVFLINLLFNRLKRKVHQLQDRKNWADQRDLTTVQACLLSSSNLRTCGRVEKRTIFVKRLKDIFPNEHVRDLVIEAAGKTTNENPFVCSHMRMQDRWHVLVQAQNHLSCVAGPYHLFANTGSNFQSAWYIFTLIGTRTKGSGRFFITPRHRVGADQDQGVMRIRCVLVGEQELRNICSGEIQTQEFFSERHKARWQIMKQLAERFEKQLMLVTKTTEMDILTHPWGKNMCGTLKVTTTEDEEPEPVEQTAEYNNFLRLHIPIPLLKEAKTQAPQDVVLYE